MRGLTPHLARPSQLQRARRRRAARVGEDVPCALLLTTRLATQSGELVGSDGAPGHHLGIVPTRPVRHAVKVDEGPETGETFITKLPVRDPGTCRLRPSTARPTGRAHKTPSVQALLGPATRKVKAPELLVQ
eukprot:9487091-Alexandrium_andersonii.AAC.1